MSFQRFLTTTLFIFFSAFLSQSAVASSPGVTVNGIQISKQEISFRAGLLRLERRGNSNSARLKVARDELIDEALKMQEAKRLNITVTEKQVDASFLNVARNLKLSVSNLNKVLRDNGVNAKTLKDRLRVGVAWSEVTQIAIMPRVQISDLELNEKAESELKETLNYDFLLKEVLFIIPQGSGISKSKRTSQANQYRKSFQGCDSAVDLSLSYRDVAVLDIGRRHATQLPDALAKELVKLNAGGITKPRVVAKGVSMLAVCSKTSARDLTFIKSGLRQEAGNEKLKDATEDYLKRLKNRASIIIH
ncbi:MAG: peptidylprolyl isomerase [Devosiaceae bacterium]|nr:peptidylprolyl isomerase [Devosiaceae bacterium]